MECLENVNERDEPVVNSSTVETEMENVEEEDDVEMKNVDDKQVDTVDDLNDESNSSKTTEETNDTQHSEAPVQLSNNETLANSDFSQTDENVIESKTPTLDASTEQTDKIKSRELKSLIAAAKESNLDTNIAHKRKSLPDQLSQRRSSSGSVDRSESATPTSSAKRNMRSQNPEFVAKHQKFISKVTSELSDYKDVVNDEEYVVNKREKDNILKRKRESTGTSSPLDEKKARKFKIENTCPPKPGQDTFCWQCHKESVQIQCVACPRSFHLKCLKNAMPICENWTCSECMMIMQAENPETQSYARRRLNNEQFIQVLKFALKRMIGISGSDPFMNPVNTSELNDYTNYVVHPMDLNQLRINIDKNVYKSTEAFTADAKWILHNSMVYNSSQSKLTSVAKSIVKTCKIEMAEIETCPECYINANTHKDTWFIEVCSKPHILVWAKLKGFPFWPAKAVNSNDSGMVDVRFFGAHDKAWVPVKDVFLYSLKDPNTITKHQKNNIAESLKEVDLHIEKLIHRFGAFVPAPLRTPFEPGNEPAQLKTLLPNYRAPQVDEFDTIPKSLLYKRSTPKKIAIRKAIKDSEDKKRYSTSSKNGTDMNDHRISSANDDLNDDDEGGYGTEEEDSPTVSETRKKFSKIANVSTTDDDKESDKSDTEPSENSPIDSEEKKVKSPLSSNALGMRTKIRGRPHISEKIRVIPSGEIENLKLGVINNSFKIELFDKSESKIKLRRDSDVSSKSSKSDVSRVSSDKINKVEFSEMTEVKLGSSITNEEQTRPPSSTSEDKPEIITKLKPVVQVNPVELINTNTEIRISPQAKLVPVIQATAEKDKKTSDRIKQEATENIKKQLNLDKNDVSTSDLKTVKNSQDSSKKHVSSTHENGTKKKHSEKDDSGTPSSSSSSSHKSFSLNREESADSDYEPETDSEDDISDLENSTTTKYPVKSRTRSNRSKVTLVDVKKIILGSNETKKSENHTNSADSNISTVNIKKVIMEKEVDNSTKIDDKASAKNNEEKLKKPEQTETKISTTTVKTTTPVTEKDVKDANISLDPGIDIKEEVLDSDEENAVNSSEPNKHEFFPALNLSPNVTLSVVEKQLLNKKKQTDDRLKATLLEAKKKAPKSPDNITKTIENVAKGVHAPHNTAAPIKKSELKVISVAEINQKKLDRSIISSNSQSSITKQKARKSFPNKSNQFTSATVPSKHRISRDRPSVYDRKIENLNAANKTPDSASAAAKAFENSKDKMVYIPHTQAGTSVAILPPNITFNSNATKFIVPQTLLTGLANQPSGTKALITTPISSITASGASSLTLQRPFQTEEERNNAEGLPPLRPRPTGPLLHIDGTSTNILGPVNQLITRSSQQMADYFRGVILETLSDLSSMGNLESKVKELQLEIEAQKHKHLEEIAALKFEITTLKQSQLAEKQKIIQETKQTCEQERIRAIEEAKSKQWCAMCLKESQYRCCWSTSYCSYACQRNHWPQHQTKCQQGVEKNSGGNSSGTESSQNNESLGNDSPVTLSTVMKPIKSTYSTVVKGKQVTKNIVTQKTSGKINFISKSGTSSVPTLTFVQNSSGGIELLNHTGPIALGGKLIPSSKMLKGYFVSSNALPVQSPNTAPVLSTLSNKTITLSTTVVGNQNINTTTINTTGNIKTPTNTVQQTTTPVISSSTTDNDVMEVDNDEPL